MSVAMMRRRVWTRAASTLSQARGCAHVEAACRPAGWGSFQSEARADDNPRPAPRPLKQPYARTRASSRSPSTFKTPLEGGGPNPSTWSWTTTRTFLVAAFASSLAYVYGVNDGSFSIPLGASQTPNYGATNDLNKVSPFPLATALHPALNDSPIPGR